MSLAAAERAAGRGAALVAAATRAFLLDHPDAVVTASVRADNAASARAFEAASTGRAPTRPTTATGTAPSACRFAGGAAAVTGPDPDGAPRAVEIAGRQVGPGLPTFVIAELSANHQGRLEQAFELVAAAAAAGADAAKLQTYRPDTMTLDSDDPRFTVGSARSGPGATSTTSTPRRRPRGSGTGRSPRRPPPPGSCGCRRRSTPRLSTSSSRSACPRSRSPASSWSTSTSSPTWRSGLPLVMSTGMATVADIDAAVGAARCRRGRAARAAALQQRLSGVAG